MVSQIIKNNRFINTIYGKEVDATPIWIMRQAGRYLPEYRATRAQAGSFMQLCKTPELACEVTLQPLNRFALDAAVIFSDILTIPDAMGLGLGFVENHGPRFERPVDTAEKIARLEIPDLEKLRYVYQAIELVQKELAGKIPVIGFVGSPFTLAAYMVEGQSKNGFPKLLAMLKAEPKLLHQLLSLLAKSIAEHLRAQIRAGASAVMIFDTWGGMLNTPDYLQFSLPYIKEAITAVKRDHANVPIILFTKGGKAWLEQMTETGCNALGIDWNISLGEARKRVGNKVALQGNMEPSFLLKSPEEIQQEAKRLLADYGNGPGHIFNLGHGITPDVPPENVKVLVDTVHEYSRQYHSS